MSFIGNLFGGGGSRSSTQTVQLPDPTPEERALLGVSLDVASMQRDILKQISGDIPDLFKGLDRTMEDFVLATGKVLAGGTDPTTELVNLYQKQLKIAEGVGATEQEKALIKEAADRAIEFGTNDLLKAEQESITAAQAQLKSRGLRTTGVDRTGVSADSPILDRASQIIQETQRQVGQLVRGVRAGQAETELEAPFRRSAVLAQQQGFQETQQQFRQSLQDALFANALKIFGGKIGLVGAPQTASAALQVAQLPRLAQTTINTTASARNSMGLSGILRGIGQGISVYKGLGGNTNVFGGGGGTQPSWQSAAQFSGFEGY